MEIHNKDKQTNKKSTNNKRRYSQSASLVANVAIGVAVIIGGGLGIFQFSRFLPIPGMKYILMSPYMTMMLYILMRRVRHKWTLLFAGGVFAMIMSLINLYMGIAILSTTILSQLMTLGFKKEKHQASAGSVTFGTTMVLTALLVSKYMIGGSFLSIADSWIFIASLLAFLMSIPGAFLGKYVLRFLKLKTN